MAGPASIMGLCMPGETVFTHAYLCGHLKRLDGMSVHMICLRIWQVCPW